MKNAWIINADQMSSRLSRLHTHYRAVSQEGTFTSGHNIKPPFLRQYFVFFNFFFSEIRDYSSTITLTQKSKFEIADLKVYGNLNALKDFKNEKSPGTDGLQAEFYKYF